MLKGSFSASPFMAAVQDITPRLHVYSYGLSYFKWVNRTWHNCTFGVHSPGILASFPSCRSRMSDLLTCCRFCIDRRCSVFCKRDICQSYVIAFQRAAYRRDAVFDKDNCLVSASSSRPSTRVCPGSRRQRTEIRSFRKLRSVAPRVQTEICLLFRIAPGRNTAGREQFS